ADEGIRPAPALAPGGRRSPGRPLADARGRLAPLRLVRPRSHEPRSARAADNAGPRHEPCGHGARARLLAARLHRVGNTLRLAARPDGAAVGPAPRRLADSALRASSC